MSCSLKSVMGLYSGLRFKVSMGLCRGYIGIMEKKMDITTMGYMGFTP